MSRRINCEEAYGNVLCHEKAVERAYELHCAKMSRSTASQRTAPERFDFLRISKSFQEQQRAKTLVRDNTQMLMKLKAIHDASPPGFSQEEWGIRMIANRHRERQRRVEAIAVQNSVLVERLKNLKPWYSVQALARARRHEKKIMRLRTTNHTAGHLRRQRPRGGVPRDERCLAARALSPPAKRVPRVRYRVEAPEEASRGCRRRPRASLPSVPLRKRSARLSTLARRGSVDRQEPNEIPDIDEEEVEEVPAKLAQEQTVVFETRRTYDATPCVVRVLASAPFTILTELCISVWRDDELTASRTLTIHEAVLSSGLSEQVSKSDWDDAHDLQEMLLTCFHEADVNGNGTLSQDEFKMLLEDSELGLSAAELELLVSEADENDDAEINYEEFLPIAIDLLQSFKARRYAKRLQEQVDERVTEATLTALYGPETEHAVAKAEALFREADAKTSTGALSRPEMRRCLKHPEVNLTRSEQNTLVKAMPVDALGKVMYGKFREKLFEVKYTTIRRETLEKEASPTERALLELCREQERLVSDDNDTGLVTATQMHGVLAHPKGGLGRLQVTSIMSEAHVVDGFVDYWKFVPFAAKTIERMHDPAVMKEKTCLLSSSSRGGPLLASKNDDLAKELVCLFDMYDVDKSGMLDASEFVLTIKSLDLGLDRGQMDALMAAADVNEDRAIDRDEFEHFTHQHLIGLIKERRRVMLHEAINAAADGRPVDTTGFDVPDSSIGELSPTHWDDDTKRLYLVVLNLFRRADATKNGCLTSTEFVAVLHAMSLGLTQYQTSRLVSEADENANGYVSFAEFVPIIMRFLQIYEAKLKALRQWDDRMLALDDTLDAKCTEAKAELATAIHIIEHAFHEAGKLEAAESPCKDTSDEDARRRSSAVDSTSGRTSTYFPRLSRTSVLRCLHAADWPQDLVDAVAARMPQSRDGLTSTSKFKKLVYEAHRDTVRRQLVANLPAESTLETHLRELLSGCERQARGVKKASSSSSDDDGEECHPQVRGLVPSGRVVQAMFASKHLRLSRQQLQTVTSLRSDCSVEESVTRADPDFHENQELMDHVKFAHCAAVLIADLFDVRKLKQREVLARAVKAHSLSLLKGDKHAELVNILRDQFAKKVAQAKLASHEEDVDEEDDDDSAARQTTLTVNDFCNVLQVITPLDLTHSEIAAVLANCSFDDRGDVLWEEFLSDATDVLGLVAHERELKTAGADFSYETSTNNLDKHQVASLCRSLVARSSLEHGKVVFGHSTDRRPSISSRPAVVLQPPHVVADDIKPPPPDTKSFQELAADETVYQDGRDLPVFDTLGRRLTESLVPYSKHLKADQQPPKLAIPMLIDFVKRHPRSIQVRVSDPSLATRRFHAELKLPSLAAVDPDAGVQFCANVVDALKIRRDAHTGHEALSLDDISPPKDDDSTY